MAERLKAWLEKPWSAGQAILYSTLALGVLDGLAAIHARALDQDRLRGPR